MKKSIAVVVAFIFSNLLFPQSNQDQINQLLDGFHHAAATADEDLFFGSMTETAHYIGTDAAEDWTRDELREWSKDFFNQETAWDFKPITRNIYTYKDESLAWFNETLNTWMGVCRGSGVVVKTSNGWKIEQYVLSVAVPNDVIKDYLELFNQTKSSE